MTLTVTIAGSPVSVLNTTPSITDKIDEQTDFSFTVQDPSGTATYTRNMPVTITDDTFGIDYAGYINNRPTAVSRYPNDGQNWSIDVRDNTWLLNKRTSKKRYAGQYAGPIFVDLIQRYCAAEGITCSAALDWDELLTEWQAGTLSGTTATTNATSDGNIGDGDLELSLAGSVVNFSQSTQSDWNSGTTGRGLTANVDGTVTLTSMSGIKFQATETIPGLGNPYTYVKIYSSGSYVLQANDALIFDVWIADSSPECKISLDLVCTDGSTLRDNLDPLDVYGISSHPKNDLSGLAKNTWYSRAFIIGQGSFAGKTISYVSIGCEGDSQGTYTAYFRRISVVNGATNKITILSDTSTALPMQPQQLQNNGYASMSCTLVTVRERHGFMYSPFFSISSASLCGSSYVSWDISYPSASGAMTFTATASIDGFSTFQPCTNNAAIPGLLPGMNLGSKSIIFVYVMDNASNDPTLTPVLSRVAGAVRPAYDCSKSDVISQTNESTGWSGGTLTNLISGGSNQLQLSGYARNWNDANTSSQTLYGGGSPAQGMNSQQFFLQSNTGFDARSRLDFAGSGWQNFTLEVDIVLPPANAQAGVVYRTTGWQNNTNTFAYCVILQTTGIVLGYGTNSASGTGTFTTLSNISLTLTAGTTYRLKVVVNGSSHQAYINDVSCISRTDSTYSAAGYVGLRYENGTGSTGNTTFDNFGIAAALNGTWVSPAIDIHAIGTISASQIALQIDPAVNGSLVTFMAEISLNNGSTWTACTNIATPDALGEPYFLATPLPGLSAGTNVSSMTQVKIRLTITASTAATGAAMPDLTAVTLWVVGAYSSSGTRISPSLSLTDVGRAQSALVAWNANLPTGTSLAVATSINSGSTWQSVASSGSGITGIATPPDPYDDSFATDTHTSYTQSNFSGTTGSWTWDTANSRLTGSGGSNGTLVYNTALTGADSLVNAIFDQCDGSGLVANYQSASAMYFLQIWDASGSGTQNSAKLFKRSGGTNTQLGSTVTIDFPRGRYRIFILDIQAGTITVSMDGVILITVTDGSPLATGKSGLLLNTLVRAYNLRIQQYGQDVSALSLLTKLTLTSTDPTVTPQVLDLQAFVSSEDIDPGALISKGNYVNTYVSDNAADLNTQSTSTWWYVRANKSVVFRQRTATSAPWVLDSANSGTYLNKKQGDLLVSGLNVTDSGDLYRNRQVLTGVIGSVAVNKIFAGDGQTTTWNVDYPLTAAPTITLNGQIQSVGVKGVDTGRNFYYQSGSTAIDQDSSGTVLQGADALQVLGTGSFATDVTRDNATMGTFPNTISQAEMAAIDGTSGIVENVTDVSSMNLDIAGAEAYGDQLLQKYGNPYAKTVTFQTYRPGLHPGQALTCFIPEQNCVGIQPLITQVGISAQIAPSVPGGVLYLYSIVATEGANLGSPWKMLNSLLK